MPKAKPVVVSDLSNVVRAELREEIRLKSKIDPETGCWNRRQAYANFMPFKGRQVAVHRVAAALQHGDIPRGLLVLHNCHNCFCVNPEHVRPGTQKENMQERWAREREKRQAAPSPPLARVEQPPRTVPTGELTPCDQYLRNPLNYPPPHQHPGPRVLTSLRLPRKVLRGWGEDAKALGLSKSKMLEDLLSLYLEGRLIIEPRNPS